MSAEDKQASPPDDQKNREKSPEQAAVNKAFDAQADKVDNLVQGDNANVNINNDNKGVKADKVDNLFQGDNANVNINNDNKGVKADKVDNVVQGDNANVKTIHDNKSIINHYNFYGAPPTEDVRNDIRNKRKRYSASISDPDFTPDETMKEAAKDIPVSTEQFDDWFYPLSDYERCFVLAMAVFHGRRVNDVVERAKQLYKPFREARKSQKKPEEQEEQEERIPRTKLEKRLYIVTRRVFGIDRFYWQDTDANKDSEFSMRLLRYIAAEAALNFGALDGYSLNEKLNEWINDNDYDIALRSARALGVFWWQNDTKMLEDEIDNWARSDRDSDWRLAASSLEGAYKINHATNKEAAEDVRHSPVLQKLRNWVIKARRKQDVNLGSTAAITYSLLGKYSPQVAMRGLDALLELPKIEVEQDYEDVDTLLEIYGAVVFCYCDLALYGCVREVLQHLSAYVKSACYNRVNPNVRQKDEQLRQDAQRELRIGSAFNILYWIADAFLADPTDMRSASYLVKGTLPEKSIFDEKKGKDLLLEGILMEGEEEWRSNISTLLCAALIEKNPELVFLLLRRWAECVMRDQSTQPDDVRKSYVRFVRDLGIQIDAWYHHLQKMRVGVPPVITAFVGNLASWKPAYRPSLVHGYVPISLLAQEVLSELPFVDGALVLSGQNK